MSLEELVFNENCVEAIPSSIGFLRNLQTVIADSNSLTEIPSTIGSCIKLRLLSLAENLLTFLPNEIGRLSCLKVLNLSGNQLKYLPFSLTKVTQLQALWLSDNHKPVMKLQPDIDLETGQKVLTCFLLPQQPLATNEDEPSNDPTPDSIELNGQSVKCDDKQVIKFSPENHPNVEDEISLSSKLIRNPTPYPKELKAHARHARNFALKQKEVNGNTPDLVENSTTELKSELVSSETSHQSETEDLKKAVLTRILPPLSLQRNPSF